MTIHALIVGKMVTAAERKTGQSGREYVRCRLAMAADGGGAQFVLVSAFSQTTQALLLALGAGAAVAVSGSMKVSIWTPPDGTEARVNLALVADAVLTLHERSKVDKAVSDARAAHANAPTAPAPHAARNDTARSQQQTAALWHQGGSTGFDDMRDDVP